MPPLEEKKKKHRIYRMTAILDVRSALPIRRWSKSWLI